MSNGGLAAVVVDYLLDENCPRIGLSAVLRRRFASSNGCQSI